VMDVPTIVAEAQRAAGQNADPRLARIIEQSMIAGLTGAEIGLKAAADAMAHEAAGQTRRAQAAGRVQMDVDGRKLEVAVRRNGKLLGRANATLNMDRTMQAGAGVRPA
nr:hypothetical protein [Acidobacteriota bacterium]